MSTLTKIQKSQEAEKLIAAEHYYPIPGSNWMVCALVLKSGYTAIGSAGSLLPDGYSADIAREVARKMAINEIVCHERYVCYSTSGTNAPGAAGVMDVMTESLKTHLQGFIDRGDKEGLRSALNDSRNAIPV